MREPISLLGWILIIFLILLIISVNVSLLMNRKKPNQSNWADKITSAGRELKDPFHKEDEKLSELASRVKQFKHTDAENNE